MRSKPVSIPLSISLEKTVSIIMVMMVSLLEIVIPEPLYSKP